MTVIVPMTNPEIYQLVLLLAESGRLLALPDARGFRLPHITIPAGSRVAEQLTRMVGHRWNLKTILIDLLRDELTATGTAILEVRDLKRIDRSLDLVEIEEGQISDSELTAAANIKLKRILSGKSMEDGPFLQLGWMDQATAWIESVIRDRGWKLTGHFQQVNASPSFSLIRFETTGEALWFKAVGEPNLRERPISVALAALFPTSVPRVIAMHAGWNAWLMLEVSGNHLDRSSDVGNWQAVALRLARLQIASLEKTKELLAAGCKHLTMPMLLDSIDPFMESAAKRMETQPTTSPRILGRSELGELGIEIRKACAELSALGLPESLGHLDFNPGNILVSSDSCVFLDWAEACISNPLFTFEYLLTNFRRSPAQSSCFESRLISAYCETWSPLVPVERLRAALELMPLIAIFAYAVGNDAWLFLANGGRRELDGYFRSLTRKMHRAATLGQERRQLCLA